MSGDDLRLVAFYLPQFHPVPENDAWWGRGFTEWTNVTRAAPLFAGHVQPRLPTELGFYDLRVPETRDAQADLAKRHGIAAFCYYFYWFDGRRLLHRPIDEMLASGRPDMPFCLCWANETLTRRWDGRDQDVLLEQVHSPESDRRFIEDALPFLADRRYLRVDGVPILLIYRPPLLSDPIGTVAHWRQRCRAAGLGGLHVAGMETFGFSDPRSIGFDSAVEFYPHGARGDDVTAAIPDRPADFQGRILDYPSVAARALERAAPPFRLFRGVMPSWDNTPRRGRSAKIFVGSTPEIYGDWLRRAIEWTQSSALPGERLVFVNAWNEWGEGAHLEPDQQHGRAYLEATAASLRRAGASPARAPFAGGRHRLG